MTFNSELSWSMLDPRPVVLYLPKYDDYLVVWNGVIMPLVHAQYIAAWWMGIYVSKSVVTELDQRYHKLYYAGAFGEQSMDEAYWRQQWEEHPQFCADLVRERGLKIYSDRVNKSKVVIE